MRTVPIAVVIPTYNRGLAVCSVLSKIYACDPKPAEIIVHVDLADGLVEEKLRGRFPGVRVLTSSARLGPGGGRHRCLSACTSVYAVSLDDDSFPIDPDFFSGIEQLFAEHPRAGILAARIWHRGESIPARTKSVTPAQSFVGCGHAVRLTAYRQVRGYLPRPIAYGMEESDLGLQLLAAGWQILEVGDLRVFHDTEFGHRESPEITAAGITNVGLCVFLHYPAVGWGWGIGRIAKIVAYCLRKKQFRGILAGLAQIPIDCYRNRKLRKPIRWRTLRAALALRRIPVG